MQPEASHDVLTNAERAAPLPGLRSRLAQDYFAPAEIAAYMGLSVYTVQDLCRRGLLRHSKLGRSIRIRRQWADAYMAARVREPLQ